MSQYPYQQSKPWELGYAADDRHVFNFFNAVYAWMAVGLAVTAAVAYGMSLNQQYIIQLHSSGMVLPLMLGLAVLSWFISSQAERIGPMVATALFLVYAASIGAVFSFIFLVYNMSTIGGAFGVTAGMFAVMSVFGFVTKRDLSAMGSILIMAGIGLFLASIVNVFLGSSGLSWLITYAVVVVFTLLTAYDTQRLKSIAIATAGNQRSAASYAIVGSLSLYVNFINIFISMLRIMGGRR